MVLLIVLETRQSAGKGSLSNHRPWWWRWKINSGSLGTLLPSKHISESGDAIEFSNICLSFTTDTTSADPINHRNELFRTYNSPLSDAPRYSCNSLLSSEHFIFKRTPRNFGLQTIYWQNSCFQKADIQSADNFFIARVCSRSQQNFMFASGTGSYTPAFILLS